jgi:subtilase family serine protease
VVAVGGTRVELDVNGALASETGWSDSGGGVSAYEAKPNYQSGIAETKRCVPDVSSDADPETGVWVYAPVGMGPKNTMVSTWLVFGGTSVSSPCVAGMVNLANQPYTGSFAFLTKIYGLQGTANFRDITGGSVFNADGTVRYSCGPGWDKVTGIGVPSGTGGF